MTTPGPILHMLAIAACVTFPCALTAHEFWIDAAPGRAGLSADLRVGQDLSGNALPYLDKTIAGMTHVAPSGTLPITARMGDVPAIADLPLTEDGLHILTVETRPAYIVFDTLREFADYLAYEGLSDVEALHRDRGLPETAIAEEYIRNARALVQVGAIGAGGDDRPTGLPFEIVAQGNPFAVDTPIDVRLTWQGRAAPDTQIALFYLPVGGTAPADTIRTLAVTDDSGHAQFASAGPGFYLLNAVHMAPADGPGSVVWRSHWASLTFVRDGN